MLMYIQVATAWTFIAYWRGGKRKGGEYGAQAQTLTISVESLVNGMTVVPVCRYSEGVKKMYALLRSSA